MIIERLVLRQFRNYGEATVDFAPGGAYITGANGSGKTNLLEAIYYLANQLSFRTTRREELQGWGAEQSLVGATVRERRTQRQSELAIRLCRQSRHLILNGKEVRDTKRFGAHFAAVVFHPGTIQVIKGGPAARRQLVDRGILSLRPEYARLFQDFLRTLRQRNALLRSAAGPSSPATAVWTERFIEVAIQIMHYRQEHVARLNRALIDLQGQLGADLGTLSLTYRPAVRGGQEEGEVVVREDKARLHERLQAEARRLQRAEEATGQTLFGPQRDDVLIHYHGKESRGYASQGEQRLTAFLLVAALATDIYQLRGYRPVMLLDDVVSELDERNRMVIFDFLKTHAFQILITDVEERPLYRDLSPLLPLRVRQSNGRAEIQPDVRGTS